MTGFVCTDVQTLWSMKTVTTRATVTTTTYFHQVPKMRISGPKLPPHTPFRVVKGQLHIYNNNNNNNKRKGKIHPRTSHDSPNGKQSFTSTLSLTSVVHGVGLSTPRPGRLTLRQRDPLPILQKTDLAPGSVWRIPGN